MEEILDNLFIVLSGSRVGPYTFGIEEEGKVKESKNCIKVVHVDYECTAHEILNICYGINDGFVSNNIGNLPSFVLPIREIDNYKQAINSKLTVLGHIKYCLKFALKCKILGISDSEIEKIRNESIGNFRVFRPVSF